MKERTLSKNMKTIDLNDLPENQAEAPPEELPKPTEPEPNESGWYNKATTFCFHVRQMKIELVMFFYMFGYMVRSTSQVNVILDKVCLVHLNYPELVCTNLSFYKEAKTEVEKLTNNYHLGHSMIGVLPSVILACFIGPWSDRYGRKMPMMVAFIAIIIDGFATTLCAHFMYTRVEYMYITALITGLSGGFITIMTVGYSYASDITKAENRTFKYALLEMALGLSAPFGSVVGGWVYKFSSYVPVFLTSTAGHILGLGWMLFALKETRGIGHTENWKTKLGNLISFDAFLECFRATMKQRPHQGRKQILLLLATMSIVILTQSSTGSLMFVYVHHVYDWDNTKYSTVSAIFTVLGIFAMMIFIPVMKKLKAGDPILGMVGSVSVMLRTIGVGVATNEGVFYLANLVGLLSSLGTLAARSRISKVVSKNDLGKVFSFVTTAEMLGPMIGAVVFYQVFNETLDIYPGMLFLISGTLILFALAVYIWLASLPAVNYEEMEEEEQQGEIDEDTKSSEKEKNLVV